MAQRKITVRFTTKKRTSIGNSCRSKPNNKHKRRCWKKYNRQG